MLKTPYCKQVVFGICLSFWAVTVVAHSIRDRLGQVLLTSTPGPAIPHLFRTVLVRFWPLAAAQIKLDQRL